VLEVGCRNGLHSIIFAKKMHDGEVWGVDQWKKISASEEIPEKVIENIRIEGIVNNVKFRNADLKKLPFLDNYFDIVCSFNFLHNIHLDRMKILLEMIRVLQTKGSLIIVGGMVRMLNYDILPLTNIRFKNFRLTKVLVAEKTKDKFNEDLILKRNPFPLWLFGTIFITSGILSLVFQLFFLIQGFLINGLELINILKNIKNGIVSPTGRKKRKFTIKKRHYMCQKLAAAKYLCSRRKMRKNVGTIWQVTGKYLQRLPIGTLKEGGVLRQCIEN